VAGERHETIRGLSSTRLEHEAHQHIAGDRKVVLQANDHLRVNGSRQVHIDQNLVIEAGQEIHLKAGASLIIDAGAQLSFKAGGEHLVIQAGGIFSSRPVVVGGIPAITRSAAPLAPGEDVAAPLARVDGPKMSPTQGMIMSLAKQLGADFCPVCKGCGEGVCDINGRAA